MEFHINFPKGVNLPKSSRNYKIFFILVILAGTASMSFAQSAITVSEEPVSANDANTVSAPSFPYVAEITGDNVNIRSGPGTNYYDCGKLYKGDRVEVVNTKLGWSCIVPPAGSFSWISMQYISTNIQDVTVGIVTGDIARVYVGADDLKPMHSLSEQIRLKQGDQIKLLGEEEDGYCKIAPPIGAYLWVSSQYTKLAKSIIHQVPLPVIDEITEDVNTAAPLEISVEAEKLKEYYDLKKRIEAERAKPADKQNYTDIKKQLFEIANNENAGKAVRYAQFVISQIESFEAALTAAKEVQLQNTELKKIMERIDKARSTKIAKTQNLGKFVVVGQFQTFKTYGPGHYRIVDDSGNMICYTLPSEQTSQEDFSKFVGKKVGLVGIIEPHSPTAGALVKFTEIVELKSES